MQFGFGLGITMQSLFGSIISGVAPLLSGGSLVMSGINVVITAPTATGTPAPFVGFSITRNGFDVTSEVVSGAIPSAPAGEYVATWTASNGVLPNATVARGLTVEAVIPADVTLVSENFQTVPYDTTPADTGYYFAANSVATWPFPVDGTITQNASLSPIFPASQSVGGITITRGAGAEYQAVGVALPIPDASRYYQVAVRGAKDNTSGTLDNSVLTVDWRDAAGAVILTRKSVSINTGDVEIAEVFEALPPAGAAFLCVYLLGARLSRCQVQFHDVSLVQRPATSVPATATSANVVMTNPNVFPGSYLWLDYTTPVFNGNRPILGVEYRVDLGSGYGSWVTLPETVSGRYRVDLASNQATATVQFRTRNDVGYSGNYTMPAVTASYLAATVAAQSGEFGALTLAGAGGFKALDSNFQEVDLTGTPSLQSGSLGAYTASISGAALIFTGAAGAPSGAVLRCSRAAGGTVDITIATVADTYSFRGETEFAALAALGTATLNGKTRKGRPGRVRWLDSQWDSKAYTIQHTIASHVPQNKCVFWEETNMTWRDPQFVTLKDLHIQGLSNPSVSSNSGVSFISFAGGIVRNLYLDGCDLDGGIRESDRLYGLGRGKGWRGILGGVTVDVDQTFEVKNCLIHDSWRALNIPQTGVSGVRRFIGNDFYYNTTDAGLFSGPSTYGTEILFNKFRDPVPLPIVPLPVTSIDVSANTMTVDDPLGKLPTGAVVINMHPDTVTMPGGLNLPGVGSNNDYQCTASVISGTLKLVSFVVDITSVGSGVVINVEPSHADFIQFVPGAGNIVSGVKIIGNRLVGKVGADGFWPQAIFLEDIAGPVAYGGTWDLTANTFTVSDPDLKIGPSPAIVTISGSGVPGGLTNGSDYTCTYTGTTTKVLQFPVDVTSSGTSYTASVRIPGYYDECVIAGNMLYNGNPVAASLYNARRSIMADNTAGGPVDVAAGSQPRFRFVSQFGYNGRDNVGYNNFSYQTSSAFPAGSDLISGNHDVAPTGYAASGIVAGPTFTANDITQLTSRFARSDLGGVIDYDAYAYDLPSINAPNAFTLGNLTGQVPAAVVSASVQITTATKYPSGASAYGILASIISADDATAQMRITSDAAGAVVVQDWTASPTIMQAGHYLWVHGTVGAAASTRQYGVRVGDRVVNWTVSSI